MGQRTTFIEILGTPVHVITQAQTVTWVEWAISQPHLHQIATTNPEFVMAAQEDTDFRRVLWQADLCIPDGIGLIWASRWLKRPLPERVPGSELVYLLAQRATQNG
jgi:N-acetylglucosaminyldiphosphoundecaprenol N-acetyl-beta-D-mannosaminyltransferase